jgi:putative endonuclease
MPDDRKPLGDRCETLAAAYLESRGYRLRHRQFRTRMGEVDLICEDGPTLVFVEVKARRSARFGAGAEAVGWRKRERLMRLAAYYMMDLPERPCRFDVIEVRVRGDRAEITHLIDAFP